VNNSVAITANSTGAVSTAPTTTRRVMSVVSARRSAACAVLRRSATLVERGHRIITVVHELLPDNIAE